MTKKLTAILVLAVMVCTCFTAFASFPDMEDTSWDWARNYVDEMVEYGIIRGYSDNTFRPGNNITKGEAMVLFSRVVGYTADGNEKFIEKAKNSFSNTVSGLSTPYTGEISYLIYKGILSEKTFLNYASDGVVDTPLKRYEAAEFLAKIATGNATLTGSVSQLSFTDNADINSTMAPYIKYVSENGIMLGMGDGSFDPMGSVTRAQMTVMLSRIIPAVNYKYIDGKIKFYNSATDSVILTLNDGTEQEIEMDENALVKLEGVDASAQALLTGSVTRVTLSNDKLIALETLAPDYDAVVNGNFKKLESISEGTNGIKITDSASGESVTYALSKSVTVKKNDENITASNLVSGDYVVLTVKDGYVTSIVAEPKNSTFSGKVVDIKLLPEYSITVLTNNKNVTYDTATSVKVTRNKKEASLEDVLVGDTVEITTTYGVISEIVATSKVSKTEGTITEVIISATPSITVTDKSGNSYTYAVTRNASIAQGSAEKSFYDLRVGDKVELALDAATATEIKIVVAFEGNSSDESSSTTITGVVESVDSAYGYIKLADSSSLVFVSKSTLQDTSGKTVTLKSITVGSTITAFVKKQNGSYEASMVVVQK